jgi:hypothetical protein
VSWPVFGLQAVFQVRQVEKRNAIFHLRITVSQICIFKVPIWTQQCRSVWPVLEDVRRSRFPSHHKLIKFWLYSISILIQLNGESYQSIGLLSISALLQLHLASLQFTSVFCYIIRCLFNPFYLMIFAPNFRGDLLSNWGPICDDRRWSRIRCHFRSLSFCLPLNSRSHCRFSVFLKHFFLTIKSIF